MFRGRDDVEPDGKDRQFRPDTLQVTGIRPEDPHRHHNVITMQISGQLWAQPYPLELLIKTDLNLESGEVKLAEGS